MDPLSIATATLTFLAGINATVKGAKRFLNAPEQLDSLMNDLTDCEIIIRNVESSLQDSESLLRIPGRELEQLCDRLEEAKVLLSDFDLTFRTKLNQAALKVKLSNSAWWVIAKGKIERFKDKLESACESLREGLGEFKTSCIELELQHVSIVVSDSTITLNRVEEQGKGIGQNVNEILRQQQQGFTSFQDQQEELMQATKETRSTTTQILAKFENIERYMLTDNLRPAGSRTRSPENHEDDPPPQYERFAVRASQRQVVCNKKNCACDCHIGSPQQNARSLRRVLGEIFTGYTGLPVAPKVCTHPLCSRKTSTGSSVTYYFPRWWVAQRMLGLVASMNALGGPQITLNLPRIVPPTARIFRHALNADIESMRIMFATGLASPADTDSKMGVTPLHYACFSVNEKSIRYLLHKGADRNAKSFEGFTPIQESWTRLLTNTVNAEQRQVLESICDEETLDDFEFTDLHRSVLKRSTKSIEEEIRALVRSSSTINDVDAQGRTALSWAAQRGDLEAMALLLEHGADPNECPEGAKTPLAHAAAMTTTSQCVAILLEHNANAYTASAGMSPLMWACVNTRFDFSSVSVLAACSDLEQQDQNERTALFHAASTSIIPTRILLREGSNVNHTDDQGYSALHLAILNKHSDIVQTLLEYGADYFLDTHSGQSLLHHAAHYADLKTINVLLERQLRGLDPECADGDGCTALDLLAARTPPPSAEVEAAFQRLLTQIDVMNHTTASGSGSTIGESEGTAAWDTASEGSMDEEVVLTPTASEFDESP